MVGEEIKDGKMMRKAPNYPPFKKIDEVYAHTLSNSGKITLFRSKER